MILSAEGARWIFTCWQNLYQLKLDAILKLRVRRCWATRGLVTTLKLDAILKLRVRRCWATRGLVTTFPLLPVHHAKLCSLCNAVIYPTIFIFMLSCIKVRRNENWARMNDFHAKSVVIICVSMSIVKSFAKSNWPPRRWSHHLRCRRHSISSKFDKHNKLPQKPNRQ